MKKPAILGLSKTVARKKLASTIIATGVATSAAKVLDNDTSKVRGLPN